MRVTATTENESTTSSDSASDLGFQLPEPARPSRRRLLVIALTAVVFFGGAFWAGYLPRRAAARELEQQAQKRAQALPRVSVVKPKLLASDNTLRIAGSIQPLEEAVIYARANGYVRRWLVDIGARVRAGELLAEIDTPEIDQELAQARAALAQADANVLQAQANHGLSQARLDRTSKLVTAGVAAEQDLEQSRAQSTSGEAELKVADANVTAQRANIRRLTDLKAFSRIVAPFAGTITTRSVDRGSLISAGNASPLFKLASTDVVRVFVQIPQDAATSIAVDTPATVSIRESPGHRFRGQVARTAGALDPVTRTLNTEVRIDNRDGKLLAGMYADVELTLASARRTYELPATALLSDASGLRVAIVTPSNSVHLQPISLDRDLGPTIHVANGLSGEETVVQIGSPELTEGAKVEVIGARR